MDFVKSIVDFLKKGTTEKGKSPEGLCPNCWGRQEYGDKFYEAVKTHGLDINSKNPKVGWIRDYAEKHLDGIKLQEHGSEYTCERCKISYHELT